MDYMTPTIHPECVKKKNSCQTEALENVLFQIRNGKKNHHNNGNSMLSKNP